VLVFPAFGFVPPVVFVPVELPPVFVLPPVSSGRGVMSLPTHPLATDVAIAPSRKTPRLVRDNIVIYS
jgi:hypothetical protein